MTIEQETQITENIRQIAVAQAKIGNEIHTLSLVVSELGKQLHFIVEELKRISN